MKQELGKALDVIAFSSARSEEIRATKETLDRHPAFGIQGGKKGTRRRATSHKPRLSTHRRPNAKRRQWNDERLDGTDGLFPECRSMRRRKGRLQQRFERSYRDWMDGTEGCVRLVTHRWHAKRFEMETKWNMRVATKRLGKGKSQRSVLRSVKESVVLHDASYIFPIVISGSLEVRRSLLSKVSDPNLVPKSSTGWEGSKIEGSTIHQIMLHRCEAFPESPIAPVQVLWDVRASVENMDRTHSQTWLFVHCAAYEQALMELKKGSEDTSAVVQSGRGNACLLKLYGNSSHTLLVSVLRGALCQEYRSTRIWKDFCRRQKPTSYPSGSVYGFRLLDCRLHRPFQDQNDSCVEGGVVHLAAWRKLTLGRGPEWNDTTDDPLGEDMVGRIRRENTKDFFQIGGEDIADRAQKRSFPVIIWQIEGLAQGHFGWSIVVPTSWCMVLWQTLVGCGAKVVGLLEWNWIQTRGQLSIFPDEYPETIYEAERGEYPPPWQADMGIPRSPLDCRWVHATCRQSIQGQNKTNGACLPVPMEVSSACGGDYMGNLSSSTYVRVTVSLIGKGTCKAGWIILSPTEDDYWALRKKTYRTSTCTSTQQILGRITSAIDRCQGKANVALAICSLEMLLGERNKQQKGAQRVGSDTFVILTSSHPGGTGYAGKVSISLEKCFSEHQMPTF